MTYFVSLKITAILIGLLYVAIHLPGALAPSRLVPLVRTLPRNYILGVVLMLLATLWFTLLTAFMDLGEISNMRSKLMLAWMLAGGLTIVFVPNFLTVRAAGCLLLLGAALVLDAAFLALTPWRYVMTLMAYYWAIAGMVLVYSPYLGRDAVQYMTRTPQRFRGFCWPGVALGVLLVGLGFFVYP